MVDRDRKLTRREFMATSGALGAGAVLASTVGRADAAEDKAMPTRVFGKTGVEIPILTMGTALQASPNMRDLTTGPKCWVNVTRVLGPPAVAQPFTMTRWPR